MGWLILSRRLYEKVVIEAKEDIPKGTKMEVMISSIEGGKVRIGFDFPRQFLILRQEVINRIAERERDEKILDGHHEGGSHNDKPNCADAN